MNAKKDTVRWKLFYEGDDYFKSLTSDVKQARFSIFIEKYIIQEDEIGIPFLHLLMQKANQGIKIKLMVDGIGSYNLTKSYLFLELEKAGIKIQAFRPVKFFSLFKASNHRRDHRKLVIIDGKTVYIGGTNIKRTHSRKVMGDEAWRDTTIRLEGSQIGNEALRIFHHVWEFSASRRKRFFMPGSRTNRRISHDGFQILENFSLFKRMRNRILFSKMIRNAKESVYIQTAYFVPGIFILHSLNRAAQRGLDIRILISEVSDVPAAQWAGRSMYSSLLKSGAKIFEYEPRFTHAKTMILDESLGIVGTTNLDYRSFLHNLEIDVLIERKDACKNLTEKFKTDLKETRQISYEKWLKRPFKNRILEKFFYIFRYYL